MEVAEMTEQRRNTDHRNAEEGSSNSWELSSYHRKAHRVAYELVRDETRRQTASETAQPSNSRCAAEATHSD